MTVVETLEDLGRHPLDRVEFLAESRDWSIERPGDDEIIMSVAGGWCALNVSVSWNEAAEVLHSACAIDLKVPKAHRQAVTQLLCLINTKLLYGHFDLWPTDGSIVFRNSLVLAGGAEPTDQQCDVLLVAGIDACERYYPALQFVIWGGQSPEKAMESALLETLGQA